MSGTNIKDVILYGLVAIIGISALAWTAFSIVSLFPDYKRKAIVYEIFVECLSQESLQKEQCNFILKYRNAKEGNTPW